MPSVQLLIKPVSGACNMRCKYCFYTDEMKNRSQPSLGTMNFETLENMVRKTLKHSDERCMFMFQGGEPTLAGIDFYRMLDTLVTKNNTRNIKVEYALQTNGYIIDSEWAEFFAKHQYLIGLSMDGNKDVHDLHRRDAADNGTYSKAARAAAIFRRYNVDFNILCVVTAQLAKHIVSVYNSFKKNSFGFQQYIPCLEPIGDYAGGNLYTLTPSMYSMFLKNLFDLWYEDIVAGQYVYIRTFENWIGMIHGIYPELCGMIGYCAPQYIVEADGGVYPCDFYVLDDYRIGDINTDSFDEIERKRSEIGFIEQSKLVDDACKGCRWSYLCRGGCRRYRESIDSCTLNRNMYCSSYKEFFDYAEERMYRLEKLFYNENYNHIGNDRF